MTGQGESNIWYFGRYAGLDFTLGSPKVLNDGAMNTGEGCASISDFNGNLLFYTDGTSVWNKTHTKMQNGDSLMGHSSSTQSAVIVKKPGANSIYTIFTVDRMAGTHGLRYTEVDMSLNNGLGDVNSRKNVPVVSPVCEKIVAINHSEGKGYWIVARAYPSNEYYSYLLDANGLAKTPIVSKGLANTTSSLHTLGYLKASRSGSRIASAFTNLDMVEIFDFDNSTGHLFNARKLNFAQGTSPYGVEFSSNEQFLYTGSFKSTILSQFDLSNPAQEAINNSRIILDSISAKEGATLQIGPDDKIYMAFNNDSCLGIINSPDSAGMACNYIKKGINLSRGKSLYGLPTFLNFNQNNFNLDFSVNNLCVGSEVEFTPSIGFADSIRWHFDDPQSGVLNTSEILNPKRVFMDTGSYTVTLSAYYRNWNDTVSKVIQVHPLPNIDLGADTLKTVCGEEGILLNAFLKGASYYWSTQSSESEVWITDSGKYWVTVSLNGCAHSDSIYVQFTSCGGRVEMPNVFTPNNDGVNDLFVPITFKDIKQSKMLIYNRWGALVYESNDLARGWDGKSKGDKCSDGVYFYVISYTDNENHFEEKKGSLTLMR